MGEDLGTGGRVCEGRAGQPASGSDNSRTSLPGSENYLAHASAMNE